IRVERGAEQRVAELRIDHAAVQWSRAADAGFLERERRGEAVAELRGIGKHLQATVTGVARGWAEERARRRRIEVVERLCGADRKPSELDERPVRVEARRWYVGRVVVHTDLQVAAKGPVLGLLPAVEPGIGAGPHQEVVPVKPILHAGSASHWAVRAARAVVIEIFTAHISADL